MASLLLRPETDRILNQPEEEVAMKRLRLAGLAVLIAAPVFAATAAPPAPQSFGESIDVRVVNVEAVVTGSRGERVRGLKAAAFRLLVEAAAAAVGMGWGVGLGMRAVVAAMRGTPAPAGRKVLVFLNGGWGFPEVPQPRRGAPSAVNFPQPELLLAPVYDTANLLGYTL